MIRYLIPFKMKTILLYIRMLLIYSIIVSKTRTVLENFNGNICKITKKLAKYKSQLLNKHLLLFIKLRN